MLRSSAAVLTAGLLVASGAGTASAATKASTSLSIREITHSSTSTVSGTLLSSHHAVAGVPIGLASEPEGSSTWTVIATLTTSSKGYVGFTVTPTKQTRYQLRFAGNDTLRGSHSGVVKAHSPSHAVESSLSIRTSSTSLAKGEKARVTGVLRVSGSVLAGRQVSLQARDKGTTSWKRERTNRTGEHGAVSFVISPQVDRQFRLVFAGDAVGKPSRSGVVTVFVRTATSLSIRESKSAIDPGGSAVVSGTLLSGHTELADRTVRLVAKTEGGHWAAVADAKTGTHGFVSFTVTPSATTSYQLAFGRTQRYNASHSGVVTLIVRQATALSITASSTSVSGVLTSGSAPLGGRTVTLYSRPAGSGAFTSVGTTQTDSNGAASFAVAPSASTDYELGFAETERYLASRSTTATVTVAP